MRKVIILLLIAIALLAFTGTASAAVTQICPWGNATNQTQLDMAGDCWQPLGNNTTHTINTYNLSQTHDGVASITINVNDFDSTTAQGCGIRYACYDHDMRGDAVINASCWIMTNATSPQEIRFWVRWWDGQVTGGLNSGFIWKNYTLQPGQWQHIDLYGQAPSDALHAAQWYVFYSLPPNTYFFIDQLFVYENVTISAPTVTFTANQTTKHTGPPFCVQFNYTGSDVAGRGNLSSIQSPYSWNFGDGNTSTEQNPVHTYVSNGQYTVSLNVTSVNISTVATNNNMITLDYPVPTVTFTANQTSTTAGTPFCVQFNYTGYDVESYAWDFGDGETSTDENPAHVFASNGTFTVTLAATNGGGSASATATITVRSPSPTASFTANVTERTEGPPLCIQFNFTGENAESVLWGFGDGQASSEVNPVHIYTQNGTFTVTLTATNVNGTVTTSSATTTVQVGPLPGPFDLDGISWGWLAIMGMIFLLVIVGLAAMLIGFLYLISNPGEMSVSLTFEQLIAFVVGAGIIIGFLIFISFFSNIFAGLI